VLLRKVFSDNVTGRGLDFLLTISLTLFSLMTSSSLLR
jgi:hypothetical protein